MRTGKRGEKGERGNKGDTGSIGSTGLRGAKGHSRISPGVLALVVMVPIFLLVTVQALTVRGDNIGNCERQSATRASELHERNNLVNVNIERVMAASSPAEADANRLAIRQYAEVRLELVDSQREVALAPNWEPPRLPSGRVNHAVEPPDETVIADCEAAYPLPWPLDLFLG